MLLLVLSPGLTGFARSPWALPLNQDTPSLITFISSSSSPSSSSHQTHFSLSPSLRFLTLLVFKRFASRNIYILTLDSDLISSPSSEKSSSTNLQKSHPSSRNFRKPQNISSQVLEKTPQLEVAFLLHF